MEELKVGLIGCGQIFDLNYPGYVDHPGASLFALCDAPTEIALAWQTDWRTTRTYTEYRDMFQDENLDAVEILTSHTLNAPIIIQATQVGKHVALLNPMTISLARADLSARYLAELTIMEMPSILT